MRRYRILHQTQYRFSGWVELLPHTLRLRPREGHELRIESSTLNIKPAASVRWYRDVEGNSVATATFSATTQQLDVVSDVIIQQYDQSPLDFLVHDYAVNYPFQYDAEDRTVLAPYLTPPAIDGRYPLDAWVSNLVVRGEKIQTFALLTRLNTRIFQSFRYQLREAEGVQPPSQTLALGSGSCRDFAAFFMMAARQLGLASRFVSGYLYSEAHVGQCVSTHAWAEVFIPGAGWKGFDPTIGKIVASEHIAVAVARNPQSIPPIAGAFNGPVGTSMQVNVQVSELDQNR